MSRHAIVYLHEPHVGAASLAEALRAAGFTLTLRLREVRPEDAEAPLVVVMGGSMGVYEAPQYPFLQEELGVLAARLKADRPVLGVCLGAQMLAATAGSRVHPGSAGLELGVEAVRWSDAGRADAALGALARETPAGGLPVAQWHGDTFEPVRGATLLASSERYAWQAFRLGASYGVQFHPEVDEAVFREWARMWPGQMERAGLPWGRFEAETLPRLRAALPGMRRVCDALAGHYAALLSPRAA
ncbi:glutamine amidotransferase [Myxococcaceae bacterium GXIMD 01537]